MMPRMSLATLTSRVISTFRKNAARYGLQPDVLEARYIFNWGGFVNASFHLTDGKTSYHLKLADDEDDQEQLARWRLLDPLLSSRYRAPKFLEWVKIPRTPFQGALFEYIPGKPADLARQPAVLRGVLDLLARLHADRELSAQLQQLDGPPETCTDAFLDLYIDRLDGDLLGIVQDLPPFVSLDLLSWMMGETRELEGLARDLPVFQYPASAPVHRDLWSSNILVGENGDFHVIDWDDLSLGDPALDYSILLGPLWREGALSSEAIVNLLPQQVDAGFRERFQVYLRAFLLDEVIDTLADWVEAEFVPESIQQVRAQKGQFFRESLERYQQVFPG